MSSIMNSRDSVLPDGGFAGLYETHAAVVFLVGDRAYKLKKPVNLGFLDFTDRSTRQAVCRREASSTGGWPRTSTSASPTCTARTASSATTWW